jgi:hypothetical protein
MIHHAPGAKTFHIGGRKYGCNRTLGYPSRSLTLDPREESTIRTLDIAVQKLTPLRRALWMLCCDLQQRIAGPLGSRRPCSQFRSVFTLMLSAFENSSCVSPMRARISRGSGSPAK